MMTTQPPLTRYDAAMQEAGMLKRWRWRRPSTDPQAVPRLARHLNVHPLVAGLLVGRGLIEPQNANHFLNPQLTDLHDPAKLPGMDRAARRLKQAVLDRQPIIVYGDYDVDGITASSILWHILHAAGANVTTYVPHRIDEGYGLNNQAIAQMCSASNKPVIVSVDCGITAMEQAAIAKAAGVDLIITDHHEFASGGLPEAHTLVHPRLPDENGRMTYPFGQLCGAGVAFKLAWHFARIHCNSEKLPAEFRELLLDLLSLAALGTVADVVPLVDENRIITRFGLGQIKRTRFNGLNALIDASKLRDKKIDAFHVGFVLGPRLNACGRMGHAERAVHLLTRATPDEAAEIAEFLTLENERRRATERDIFDQAREMVIKNGYDKSDCRAIVLGREGWHAGVVGIVAARLVEAFARPVIMLNFDNGEAHGSARSVDGVSIHDALEHCKHHLTSFGGHAMAAGLRLPTSKVDALRDELVAFVNERLKAEDLVGQVQLDAECELQDLSLDLFEQIQSLAPFGRENPAPAFCVRNALLQQPSQRVGGEGRHLRLVLRQGEAVHSAIAFGLGYLAEQLPSGVRIDVAFEPEISTWQGRRQMELRVNDVRLVHS